MNTTLHDKLSSSMVEPKNQEFLRNFWVYSVHLYEILKNTGNPALMSKICRELCYLYKKNNTINRDFIIHLEYLTTYYNPESTYAEICNAWNYLGSPMPKYVKWEPPLEMTNGEMTIGEHIIKTEGQLLPRIKTLSLSKHVINNFTLPHTILVDLGTWTGAVPLFISQQDIKGNIDMSLWYDLEYTIELFWKSFQQQSHWASTREDVEKDLIIRNILPEKHICITANLPYWTQQDYKEYPQRVQKEPVQALVWWGIDGLDIYRTYINWLSQSAFLKNIYWMLFEGSSKNISLLFDLCKQRFPWYCVELLPDYFGKDRFVQMKSL